MKKFIIIIFGLTVYFNANSQTPHPAGSYNAHPELDKFVGTWQWTSGNDTLTIMLYKQAIHFPGVLNYDEECLVGWHKYVKNGSVIESNLQYAGLPYFGGHSSIFAWNQSTVKLYGSLTDLTKSKECDIYLKMTNSSYTQMSWRLMESRGLKSGSFQGGFTMPVNLVLTKL